MNVRKLFSFLVPAAVSILLCLAVLGCGNEGRGGNRRAPEKGSGGDLPQRIVSLNPGVTEILYALGAGKELVGLTDYCNYPPQTAEKTRVGGFSGATVSVETIAALRPDLVIVSEEMHGRVVELLDNLGIASLAVEPENFSEVYDVIRLLGARTGYEENALLVIDAMQKKIEQARLRWQGREVPGVFWELWDQPLLSAGAPTLISEAIALAGGRNIFEDLNQRWPEVSYEEVLRRRPQWILSASDHKLDAALLAKRPSWSRIPAVEAGRIASVDADMINRYGPRLADAVLLITEILHP
ncbi:MAG: cobalamin-binding protein [Spirochaetaceae bacterium]|nr:cobalamin-binding protein [Spirochaetaceae bacterium]